MVHFCIPLYLDIEGDGTETTAVSHQVVFFHKMGSNQAEDLEVISFPNGQGQIQKY